MFKSRELHEGSSVNDFFILTKVLGRKIASKSVFVMFSFWWKFEEPFAKAKWANQKCASVHCCLDALAFVIFSLYKFDSLIDSKWANMMHSKPPPSTHAFTFTCFYFHFHKQMGKHDALKAINTCFCSHATQPEPLLTKKANLQDERNVMFSFLHQADGKREVGKLNRCKSNVSPRKLWTHIVQIYLDFNWNSASNFILISAHKSYKYILISTKI